MDKSLLIGLSLLLLSACAHGTADVHSAADVQASSTDAELVARLEKVATKQQHRISELEARIALLEHEARNARARQSRPRSIRIGAERRAAQAAYEPRHDARDEPSAVPVLRLHGDPKPRPAPMLEPLPAAPAGMATTLPVVPLPEDSAAGQSDPEARAEYRRALALVRQGKYPQARQELTTFVVRNPNHPLADNAVYWQGEVFYLERQYGRALEVFESVAKRYPSGNKVPDALLKAALCHQRLGDATRATAYFKRVQKEFPNSQAARIASREGSS